MLLAVVLWRMASTGGQSAHDDSDLYEFPGEGAEQRRQGCPDLPFTEQRRIAGRDASVVLLIANTAIPDVTKVLQDHNVIYNYKEVKNADWLRIP